MGVRIGVMVGAHKADGLGSHRTIDVTTMNRRFAIEQGEGGSNTYRLSVHKNLDHPPSPPATGLTCYRLTPFTWHNSFGLEGPTIPLLREEQYDPVHQLRLHATRGRASMHAHAAGSVAVRSIPLYRLTVWSRPADARRPVPG